jgi:hypothetical protein
MAGARRRLQRLRLVAAASFLLLCASLGRPAQAQSCDRYDSAATATDLAEIRNQVRAHLPARFADMIGRLEFRMVEPDDEETIFPRAIIPMGASAPYIEIPSDYYRVHCQTINLTKRLFRVRQDSIADVLLTLMFAHRDCTSRRSRNFCFRQSIETVIPNLEPETPDDQLEQSQVRDAFFLVIAHEIAHVLLGEQRSSDPLVNALDQGELAADALALQAAILAGRDYRRLELVLFPASLLEGTVDFEDRPGELILANRDDSSCRSALASATGKSLGPEIGVATEWALAAPADTSEGPDSPSLAAKADRARQGLTRTDSGGLNFDAVCRLPTAQIDALGRDYRSLLVEIDRTNGTTENPDRTFRSLLLLRPQSEAVRSFAQTIFVFRITNKLMAAFERRDPNAERQLFHILDEVAVQIDRDSISSLARGNLALVLGFNRERFAAAGSSIDRVISAAEADLLDAERFLDASVADVLSGSIARLRLLQGDCAGANRRYALLRNSANRDIAAQARRFSNLENISPSSCEAVVAEMRSELRARRGWQ